MRFPHGWPEYTTHLLVAVNPSPLPVDAMDETSPTGYSPCPFKSTWTGCLQFSAHSVSQSIQLQSVNHSQKMIGAASLFSNLASFLFVCLFVCLLVFTLSYCWKSGRYRLSLNIQSSAYYWPSLWIAVSKLTALSQEPTCQDLIRNPTPASSSSSHYYSPTWQLADLFNNRATQKITKSPIWQHCFRGSGITSCWLSVLKLKRITGLNTRL